MVASIGLPYAYYQFEGTKEHPAPDPPFVCFYYTESDDMFADDSNYARIERLVIELYADNKSFDLEDRAAAALAANGLTYEKSETWLDDERMYMTIYNAEVLITNGTGSQ